MSGVQAKCSNCSHLWKTRKPLDEIDRPRCAECGAEEEAIQFDVDQPSESTDTSSDPSVLTRAQRRSKRETLLDQLDDQLERLDDTAPPESDETVAYELRESYYEVSYLKEELQRIDDPSLDELKEIESYLDSVVETIDEYAEELECQNPIRETITQLESHRDRLHMEIKELVEKKETLETDLKYSKLSLRNVHSEVEAFDRGREYGRRKHKIEIPCGKCGNPILMKPKSKMHNTAINLLQERGVRHPDC